MGISEANGISDSIYEQPEYFVKFVWVTSFRTTNQAENEEELDGHLDESNGIGNELSLPEEEVQKPVR